MDTIDLEDLRKKIKYYDYPVDVAMVLKLIDYIDFEAEKRADDAYDEGYQTARRKFEED